MKRVVIESAAKAELRKARRWYEKRQSGLGEQLLNEALQGLERIERDELIGMRYAATRFRFHRLRRFPYLIFYEILPDRLRVVAIAHERQRPGYWQRRKPE